MFSDAGEHLLTLDFCCGSPALRSSGIRCSSFRHQRTQHLPSLGSFGTRSSHEQFFNSPSALRRKRQTKEKRSRHYDHYVEGEDTKWCFPRFGLNCLFRYGHSCRCLSIQDNFSASFPFKEHRCRKFNLQQLGRMANSWHLKPMHERGRSVLIITQVFLMQRGMLLLKGFAIVGGLLLLGVLSLYAQAKAQAQIQKRVLPPIASIMSAYTGRHVTLGKVQTVSPMGITLEYCALGPHHEEFSCGELPMVELKLRPLASIQRQQIVFDAVLVQPNILVSQKKDWSWLGIPTPTEKTFHRCSSEEGLDSRTKARRVAREQISLKLLQARDNAARRAAACGYILRNEEQSNNTVIGYQNGKGDYNCGSFEYSGEKYMKGDEMPRSEESDRLLLEGVRVEEERDWKHKRQMPPSGLKSWLDEHVSVPIFKHWSTKATVKRVEGQRQNLDASASAARAFFERLDLANKREIEEFQEVTLKESCDSIESARLETMLGDVMPEESDSCGDQEDAFDRKNSGKHFTQLEGEKHVSNSRPDLPHSECLSDSKCVKDKRIDQEQDYGFEGNMDPVLPVAVYQDFEPSDHLRTEFSRSSEEVGAYEDKSSHESLHQASSNIVFGTDRRLEDGQGHMPELESLSAVKDGLGETGTTEGKTLSSEEGILKHELKFCDNTVGGKRTKIISDSLVAQAKSNFQSVQNWLPMTLDSVYIRDGTLMLLAYGDSEPRVMENVNGFVKLANKYAQVDVHISGKLNEWRTTTSEKTGGRLLVKVLADIRQQKWHVKLKGNNLFAPLLERLLEIPFDWSDGRASGELNIWASKGDLFPNLSGRLDVSQLAYRIWEAPAAFKDVKGTLFFQGQRLFLHNTSGFFGAIPLQVSGDMDLNPDGGEYRLVCQVPNVEVNVLMDTLKARPPMFPVAGAIKAAVYCRGPLEVPVFAGSAEISKKNGCLRADRLCTAATEALKRHEYRGAVAAFDRIPFLYASANFTFDIDNCVADLYGIRATLVDGGELRGAGNLWLCPEGEVDPGAVNMDLSGHVLFDSVVQNYLPDKFKAPPIKLDYVHGDAKIQGSLLQPVFDIKWNAPEAKGAFNGFRGDINISHEAIAVTSSAFTFDLLAKIHTSYPPLSQENTAQRKAQAPPPEIEGLDVDLRMRGFDLLGMAWSSPFCTPAAVEGVHSKIMGRVKFQGRVVKLFENSTEGAGANKKMSSKEMSGVTGEILLSGLKLNQFVVAPHLSGSMDIFQTKFKLDAVGRADEHLKVEYVQLNEMGKKAMLFSLERGQLRMSLDYQPGCSANLEVRNLQLDELELASLRGVVQKTEAQLNFQKRRGYGNLSVRRPRFSGVQGESLDVSCRWSGDVITIERSVLEQANSRYELQGEYVLPGPRDHAFVEKERGEGTGKTAMAGQLGSFIRSLGRWRLQLEVPGAEVADMLPMARLLLRSSDPAVVSRSKELFMQGIQHVGFYTENLKQQLENFWSSDDSPNLEEGTQESVPLPGLAELKGLWHGIFEASGGGNGDTSADFDFHGDEWEWGTYKVQRVTAVGNYSNNDGLHLDKIFIQKDSATLHADGTLLGPKSNLHFAVLNFPIGLVPPLMHAIQSSTLRPVSYPTRTSITSVRGILYMEGDLRGPLVKPQCDVQVRLLDGAVGGVDLGRAEVVASVTSANRFNFNAKFEPLVRSGHVHVRGSLPLETKDLDAIEDDGAYKDVIKMKRIRGWNRNKSKDTEAEGKKLVCDRLGDEGWEVKLAESLKELDWDFSDKGAMQIDANIKDAGMMLITALSPHLRWLQGNVDLTLQVRGTVDQPSIDGVAAFHRVSISSPVLPRPLSNFGGTIRVLSNQLCIEGLEGRVGRKGRILMRGKLPLKTSESSFGDNIELKADLLEVRAKNVFSGQVDSQIQVMGSLLEPVVLGMIKLSHGEAYLPQEKGVNMAAASLTSSLSGMAAGGRIMGFSRNQVTVAPDRLRDTQLGLEDKGEDKRKSLVAIALKNLKLYLGPELRVVYPLILNFAVSGELELNGLADPQWIKPKGSLTFENGDVNLVATQVRLNRDHPNRAKFEPEQGLDPTLDLALVGADWQLKIQGRARNWQDNLVITSTRSGEPDALTRTEAARVFESQLADSLLEGNGQLAFKKLAAATVETLMPKIEGKGEFGQARWRLVSAPQIPNLLSLDPTTDPFKSLANLSFGTEVEVQLGKRLQASVVRQLKESEMATQWTLMYQLNSKLRILFSSIPSVDNRLLFEYSATSQN